MDKGASKSLLPLIEIIVSVSIFSFAAVLALQMFMMAHFLSRKTSDIAEAMVEVQNLAETLKSYDRMSEYDKFVLTLPEQGHKAISFTAYEYDAEWNAANGDSPAYRLIMTAEELSYSSSGKLMQFNITVYKNEPYPFLKDQSGNIALAEVTLTKFYE